MPTSVRLDRKTEAAVRRLAKQHGRTKSEVIRDAIARMAEESASPPISSAYEAVEDLLGMASGGPPDLARRADHVFADLLAQRRRPR
ncbi:MAG: ribbon-helix-helix protein, CopG family [bacterium]